jgi:predicted dehydrogenase
LYKIGLIGAGRWGEKIANTLSTIDDARLVAICQRTPKELSWLPSDCIVYDNISDMLRKETLTHIITAIDPRGHFDVVEKATKYGLPVWLEKPMALSYAEAEKIFALGGQVFVDYIHLYSECFKYLYNNITGYTDITSEGYGFGINTHHNFPLLYDYASHELSMLLTMFDDITIQHVDYIHGANGEYYKIAAKSDNDCNIIMEIGNDGSHQKSKTLTVDTKNGSWVYDGLQQNVSKIIRKAEAYYDTKDMMQAKELPLKHALKAFLSGERVDKDMTLKITELLDEIEARSKRGQ